VLLRCWLTVLALVIGVIPASAELITFRIDATVAAIPFDNTGQVGDLGVFVGSDISALLTLNTEAQPLGTSTNYYVDDDPVIRLGSLFIQVGGLEIGSDHLLFVRGQDNRIRVEVEDVTSNFGFFDMITLDLFASSALPDYPLAALATTMFTSGTFQAGWYSQPSNAIHIASSSGTVRQVPEPSVLLLTILGGAAAARAQYKARTGRGRSVRQS
jgi:hypothetical protein